MDDDYVDYELTDMLGQRIRIYMLENGGMIMRWDDDYKLHLNREQTKQFIKALGEAVKADKPLTIRTEYMQ